MLSALLAAGSVNAGIVVDDFTKPASLVNNNPPGFGLEVAGNAGPGILGGWRQVIYAVNYGAATTASVEINTPTSPNRLTESSGVFGTPDVTLVYDNAGLGLSTVLDSFTVDMVNFKTDLPLTITVVIQTDALDYTVSVQHVPASYAGDIWLAPTSVVGSPDGGDVNSITVDISGPAGADFSLDSIETVPEPGAWALLAGLGLVAFAVRRFV